MWVIPFDNFERSTSNVASVGLMLDPRVHPEREDLDAEAEFMDIVSRFPDMARHMEGIQAVRPFTRTDRLQYSAITSVGDRFLLSPSTYGFIDALYSNGLVHTFESIHFAAHHLLSALARWTERSRRATSVPGLSWRWIGCTAVSGSARTG